MSKTNGIWHLNAESLDDVDEIVNDAWERMTSLRRERMDREVKRKRNAARRQGEYEGLSSDEKKRKNAQIRARVMKLEEHPRGEQREITFTRDNSDKKVRTQSFAEARVHPDLKNETTKGFRAELRSDDYRLEIELESFWGSSIRVSASPEESEFSREFEGKLDFWVERLNAPWWQRKWSGIAGFHWLLFALFIGLVSNVVQIPSDMKSRQRDKQLKMEAHQLLREGISDDERERKAISKVLALLSDFGDESESALRGSQDDSRILIILGVALVVSVMLSFPPKTTIGIGKGVSSINRQRAWINIITVLLPGFIIMGVIASALGSAAFEYFRQSR